MGALNRQFYMVRLHASPQRKKMSIVKDIKIKVIPANVANDFIVRNHYSGKYVRNSSLHFGAIYNGVLHGVISFGSSINKKGTVKLVQGTKWNEFIELNRMAFDDFLPKNSESRCLGIALRLLKKNAPHIKWVISFADAGQCGHGTIYMAANFKLVEIVRNTALKVNPETGEKVHTITAYHKNIKDFNKWESVEGYQLKYVY